jgi:hypothetical protein
MGVAGAIAGGCVMGYRAKKKFLANKKLSKKQKKERGLSK